jgi:coenzyme F420-reducing hydrogenase delta subunit
MTFVSASEGAKWGAVVTDVVNMVRELGPSPITEFKK